MVQVLAPVPVTGVHFGTTECDTLESERGSLKSTFERFGMPFVVEVSAPDYDIGVDPASKSGLQKATCARESERDSLASKQGRKQASAESDFNED